MAKTDYMFSAPISVMRYSNGTLVKLTATAHEFVSYDYDAEDDSGTYFPRYIDITAEFQGDVKAGVWTYSEDGITWAVVDSGSHGMTITGNTLRILPTSDVFDIGNSQVTIRHYGDDETHYDTVTILRSIDGRLIYRNLWTDVQVDRHKIALIASDTQIQQFTEQQTMVDKMAAIEVKADAITSTVQASYATKAYTDAKAASEAQSAEADSKQYIDRLLSGYSTTAEMRSEINQKADSITQSVAGTYATQTAVEDAKKVTMVSDTLHYLATSAATGVTRETSGWTTTTQSMTATKRYLWIYHTYKYGDNKTSNTNPIIAGVWGNTGATGATGDKGDKGDPGVGITSVTEYYALNNSLSAPADSAFSTGVKTPTATNRYLWNYELITYTDESTKKTSKHIAAMFGQAGRDGVGISSVVDYYALSTSATAPGDSSFSTTVRTVTATNKYLWNYELITYTDSTTERTSKRIIGVYGDKGDPGATGARGAAGQDGVGIKTVIPLYYVSNSAISPDAPTSPVTTTSTAVGIWTRSVAELTSTYKYLYMCDQIQYTNNNYGWTPVVMDNATAGLSLRLNNAELKITDEAIVSTVTETLDGQLALRSVIEQNADAIRMQAGEITWQSDNSTMSGDGTFTTATQDDSGRTIKTILKNGSLQVAVNNTVAGSISSTYDSERQVGRMDVNTTDLAIGSSLERIVEINSDWLAVNADDRQVVIQSNSPIDIDGGLNVGGPGASHGLEIWGGVKVNGTSGYSGKVKYISDIQDAGGGDIEWAWKYMQFIDGIMVNPDA